MIFKGLSLDFLGEALLTKSVFLFDIENVKL